MSYPKWRHHPQHESVIVHDAAQEASQTGEGWGDDRYWLKEGFASPEPVPAPQKHKGGRPRKAKA